jgi:hypothetical protein
MRTSGAYPDRHPSERVSSRMVQKYMSSQVVTLHSIQITGIAQTRVPKICGLEDRSNQYITVDDSVSDSLTFYPLLGGFLKISLMILMRFPVP